MWLFGLSGSVVEPGAHPCCLIELFLGAFSLALVVEVKRRSRRTFPVDPGSLNCCALDPFLIGGTVTSLPLGLIS